MGVAANEGRRQGKLQEKEGLAMMCGGGKGVESG